MLRPPAHRDPRTPVRLNPQKLDPLKRVFVPIERNGRFQTLDGQIYERTESGAIRRDVPKRRGKAARRAEKALRRRFRQALNRPQAGQESVQS